jgi:hypothetical protein
MTWNQQDEGLYSQGKLQSQGNYDKGLMDKSRDEGMWGKVRVLLPQPADYEQIDKSERLKKRGLG